MAREASYVAKIEARNEQLLLESAALHKQLLQSRLDGVAAGYPPVEVLKTLIEACPRLMWAKRRIAEGQYVYVAVSYPFSALYYGGPPKSLVGKGPEDYMPKEVADRLIGMDELCFTTQAPVILHQKLYGLPTKAEGTVDGCKFCVRLSDGYDYVIGIADHLADQAVVGKNDNRRTV